MIKKIMLKLSTLVFIASLLLTGCASNTAASPPTMKTDNLTSSPSNTETDSKSITTKDIDDYAAKIEFSGTILAAKDDKVLLVKGYGMADYDKMIVNRPQTVFEIGSITKQFTSMAILMLQEDKLLSVHDTISKYIPDYPKGDKIKIYNLLTHTSGIPEYLNYIESLEGGKHKYTPEEIIEIFKSKPFRFNTGTKFEYINSNYILLGYIIEKVSGMKYGDFLDKNIFKPLKMNDTGLLSTETTIKSKAIGYSMISSKTNEYTRSAEIESSLPYAAGEIYSTVEDLYRWSNALNTEKLIKKQSLDEMFTPYIDTYGYGWFINKSSDGNKTVYHGGSIPGYSAFIEKDINEKNVIIVLSNQNQNNAIINDIVLELRKILELKK